MVESVSATKKSRSGLFPLFLQRSQTKSVTGLMKTNYPPGGSAGRIEKEEKLLSFFLLHGSFLNTVRPDVPLLTFSGLLQHSKKAVKVKPCRAFLITLLSLSS